MKIIKILGIYLLFVISILNFIGCSGSSSNDTATTSSDTSKSQALLGPVINADVNLYKVSDNSLLYSTVTIDNNELSKAGSFDIPNNLIENTQYYLLEIIGGKDIDANDDGIRDNLSTIVNGTIHSVVLGSDLLNGNTKVNPLSEITYQKLKPILNSSSKTDNNLIQTKINEIAKLIIKTDINGDGIISEKDIHLFSPKDDKGKIYFSETKLLETISFIHSGNEQNLSILANNLDFSLIEYSTGDNEYGSSINIEDNYLFLANYNGMKVFDITDIYNPIMLYTTNEKVGKFVIAGNYLYTGYSKVLKIFDISDKNNITLKRTIDLVDKFFRDIKIRNNYLLLLTSNATDQTKNGITVFDITDINNFNELSFYQGGDYHQLILNDTTAIVVYHNTGGFDILDISNLSNISLIEQVRENGDHSSTKGATIDNNNLYLGFYNYGMRIYDINNSSVPVKLGEIYLGYDFTEISVSGNYAYAANTSWTQLKIIDITDKTKPILVTTVVTQASTYDSKIKNNQLYLSTKNGFQVININQSWNTSQDYISKYTYPTTIIQGGEGNFSTSYGKGITIDNNGIAYLSGGGVISLDLSEPTNPTMLDQIYSYGSKSIIKKYNDYIYTGGYQNFLEIINASDNSNLTFGLENSYATNGGQSFGIDFKNNYAYVLGYNLNIIDITENNNSNAIYTGNMLSFETGNLKIKDDYLYVATDINNSILIYDIVNQISPTLKNSVSVNSLNNSYSSTDMEIVDDALFLVTSIGFEIFNITNRENPTKLSVYEGSNMYNFKVYNNIVYLSSSKGITILNIQDLSNPILVGYYNITNSIGGLDIWDEYLYVTTDKELLIYPLIKYN